MSAGDNLDQDKVMQVQMMEIAEGARKALAADASVLVVAYEHNSASAIDLRTKDRDSMYEAMRGIVMAAERIVNQMTEGRIKLLIQIEGEDEPAEVSKRFGVARTYQTGDPRDDF